MKVVVFLGPSLSVEAARAVLDATYLPPARRGDVAAALERHRPDAIALVDGFFEQVPAVWHKELLFALSEGVAVAGAASMGALRAAELSAFGMVGLGRIFEAYRAGRFAPFDDPFEGDDEVAVVHGPAEIGYPATDALVDIRATVAAAMAAGVLSGGEGRALVAAAKALFYKDRTYPAVSARARADGFDGAALARFETFRAAAPPPSCKRQDAEALLAALAAGTLGFRPPAFRFEPTLLWETFLSRRGPAP